MHPQADSSGPFAQGLHAALLDYFHSPGKYPVTLRQPPLLFGAVREILQLAAGRGTDGSVAADDAELRAAARFFTRTALLYPGADHYALLGLDQKVDSAEVKDRYRLLMRLIHPDFAGTGDGPWPADAAVRVNLANEVLSSAVKRREYDAHLAAAADVSVAVKVDHRRITPASRPAGSSISRSSFKKLVAVCSVIGVCVVLGILFVGNRDAVHLVQRSRAPAVEPKTAAVHQPAPPVLTGIAPNSLADPAVAVSPLKQTEPSSKPSPAPTLIAAPHLEAEHITAAVKQPQPQRQPSVSIIASVAPVISPPIVQIARTEPPASPPPGAAAELPQPPPPIAAAVSAPAPVPLPQPRPVPVAGVSLAEVQPLLSLLLQHLESGRGERLIDLLDREARAKPAAQALSQQYDGLVDGMRPVRLSHVEFKSEPADGRLLVTGHIRLQVGEHTIGSMGKKMVLRAEFALRQGAVVMTGLSGAPGNDQ
jgi:hypothetical protein